jgi:hypothetical protein
LVGRLFALETDPAVATGFEDRSHGWTHRHPKIRVIVLEGRQEIEANERRWGFFVKNGRGYLGI